MGLGEDSEVLLYDGCTKRVQDLVRDDLLMGSDSSASRVLDVRCTDDSELFIVSHRLGKLFTADAKQCLSFQCHFQHRTMYQ